MFLRVFVLLVVSVFAVVVHRLFFPQRQRKLERRNIRREILQDMPIREFNRALKKAYEKHKGNPVAFVKEVPYVCDNYESFDMERMCGFANGTYDIKKSMFASYLVKVERDV